VLTGSGPPQPANNTASSIGRRRRGTGP
jgi:hypothetical protein